MAALFGGSSGSSRREPRSLVEFRAGKMQLSGTTVTADARKGLIYMKLDDGLVHFYWKDRKNSKVVDDLIIFPGDAEFKQVVQCKTGRVFLLKFRDSSRKYFYWMQEPNEEKDDELVKKVNDIIDHPPDPSQPSADALSGLGLPPGLMNNPQILEQLISSGAVPPGLLGLEGLSRGGSAGSSLAAAVGSSAVSASSNTPSGSSTRQHTSSRRQQQPKPENQQQSAAGRAIQLSDLQSILSSITVPESSNDQVSVNLNEALTSDVLRPLSNDTSLHEQVSSFLPPTSEDVPTILNSPQFHQALGIFGSALQSGQLGPLMTQFGLGQGVTEAANMGDVQRFAEALQTEMCADGTPSESTESDKPKDEDSKNENKCEDEDSKNENKSEDEDSKNENKSDVAKKDNDNDSA